MRSTSLARKLREGRLAAGLTQEAVAEQISVSRTYIAKVEGGHMIPAVDTLDALLRLYKMRVTTEEALGLYLDAHREVDGGLEDDEATLLSAYRMRDSARCLRLIAQMKDRTVQQKARSKARAARK